MSHWNLHPFRSRSHKPFLARFPIDSCEDKERPVRGSEIDPAADKITSVKFASLKGETKVRNWQEVGCSLDMLARIIATLRLPEMEVEVYWTYKSCSVLFLRLEISEQRSTIFHRQRRAGGRTWRKCNRYGQVVRRFGMFVVFTQHHHDHRSLPLMRFIDPSLY